jgi:hypothetical protein
VEDPNSRKQYTARLERFRVSISGRNGLPGFYEYVEPNDILEGRGRNADLAGPDTQYMKLDLFISNAVVVATPAGSLILKFATAELNGGPVASQTISLRLVEKTGVLACVQ